MSITYSSSRKITALEFISILERSTLSERRPVDDFDRVVKMVENGQVMISAWDGEILVGIARTITDFAYCSYMSDLAVDATYQHNGIGRELIRLTREVIGYDVMLLLVAAPAATNYYQKVGFTHIEQAWIIFPDSTQN